MTGTPTLSVVLLQAGLVLGAVVLARIIAGHHVPAATLPTAVRGRVELWNRLCPRLFIVAVAMAGTGLVLELLA